METEYVPATEILTLLIESAAKKSGPRCFLCAEKLDPDTNRVELVIPQWLQGLCDLHTELLYLANLK